MTETPFGSLESLVGRTFEREGHKRTIVFVGAVETQWIEPGHDAVPVWNEGVCDWLSGAKEVTP
jgi:hypothetical protein